MARKRLVILISGSGSNLQAFIDATRNGELDADIACVISNKAGVFGLERATQAGIPTRVLSHRDYTSREDYDAALLATVQAAAPDLVGMPVYAETLRASARTLRAIREALPRVTLVAGGPQASADPLWVLDQIPELDCVLAGEAEKSLPELERLVRHADRSVQTAAKRAGERIMRLGGRPHGP